MKRSNPSTVVGGGEMKRDTSSVVSSACSDGASDGRSWRSVARRPPRAGSARCQSEAAAATVGGITATASRTG